MQLIIFKYIKINVVLFKILQIVYTSNHIQNISSQENYVFK